MRSRPSLTTANVLVSLSAYVAVYAVIYAFGLFYIYRLLRDGPADEPEGPGDWRDAGPADGRRACAEGGVSAMEPSHLALFWAGVIAVAILAYVILDGFDLGIGILFGTTGDEALRDEMMAAISPFWDGNETWLVVVGTSLFAAFPTAYAVFLPAFYIPVLLLLIGLIFRGVAFEFRHAGARKLWHRGFYLGSTVAAFVQGAAVGAMIRGIPVANGQYAGGPFEWLAPLPALCGIGLVLGYALLGAGWLVRKCEGALREWARRRIPWLAVAVLVVLARRSTRRLPSATGSRPISTSDSGAWYFPAIGLLAMAGVLLGVRWRRDGTAVRHDGRCSSWPRSSPSPCCSGPT